MEKQNKIKHKFEFSRYIFPVFTYFICIVWCIIMLTIVIFAILTAFRKNLDFIANPGGFPKPSALTLDNFKIVFEKTYLYVGRGIGRRKAFMPEIIYNTLFYSFTNPFFAMVTCACVSYVACRYRKYKFVKFIYPFTVVLTYLPFGASLATTIVFLKNIGLYDNMYLYPLYTCGAFGMDMLVYYATWQGFSGEYGDAAAMDGASPMRIFLSVYFPLGKGTFFTLFIMKFITHFQAWEVNLSLLPSYPLIGYLGYQFQYSQIQEFSRATVQVAGLLIVSLPVFIIFMSGRKTFMSSLSFGGLKG